LLSLLALRGALVAAPFVAWFVWRAVERRLGREPRATPWPWLIAAAGLLLGLSLMATAVFRTDNRGQTYIPGEVTTDGRVSEGRYEAR
jgi:branched-subunit amino acid ABC-type transport system permease component